MLKLEEAFADTEALLTYIEHAIKCFVRGSSILRLAEVRCMKAKLLLRSSYSSEDEEARRELCKEECEMAYCIYDIMECEAQQREIERFCEEELQWHITMQMK